MLTEGRIIIFANIHVLVCFIITRPIVIDSILILSVTSVISPHGSELDTATRVYFFFLTIIQLYVCRLPTISYRMNIL